MIDTGKSVLSNGSFDTLESPLLFFLETINRLDISFKILARPFINHTNDVYTSELRDY